MIFDAHCHIIDPRFPLIPNQGYLPPAFDVAAYQAQAVPLGITGGAVVSGSFQGFDQSYLIDALGRLGDGFVGVTQVPVSITDEALADLHRHNVRALRFNLRRGGSEPLEELERMALRVHQGFGWHVELYVDSRDLAELAPHLSRLPALSIDHLGLSAEGLPHLLRLVEQGARVKACGFGRVDFAVAPALQQLHAANPEALMFGSDLPSTRAPRPFEAADITLIRDALGDAAAHTVLWDNARRFYRLA